MSVETVVYSFAFQPIVDPIARTIVSYEALVRGADNEPASSVLGGIGHEVRLAFDEQLRRDALSLAARLGIRCSINLNLLPGSMVNAQESLAATIGMASQLGVALDRIIIEITETEAVSDLLGFRDAIDLHRSLGIKSAIDDFGAGYSGLNLLADFQPESIKIDMSLIRGINVHGPRQAIVRGIIRTCSDLGIDIVAEGIESEAEWRWCAAEGIQFFQGFFFAKPGFEFLPLAFYPAG
jgi:blue light- and temperature-responsive anti-repressor